MRAPQAESHDFGTTEQTAKAWLNCAFEVLVGCGQLCNNEFMCGQLTMLEENEEIKIGATKEEPMIDLGNKLCLGSWFKYLVQKLGPTKGLLLVYLYLNSQFHGNTSSLPEIQSEPATSSEMVKQVAELSRWHENTDLDKLVVVNVSNEANHEAVWEDLLGHLRECYSNEDFDFDKAIDEKQSCIFAGDGYRFLENWRAKTEPGNVLRLVKLLERAESGESAKGKEKKVQEKTGKEKPQDGCGNQSARGTVDIISGNVKLIADHLETQLNIRQPESPSPEDQSFVKKLPTGYFTKSSKPARSVARKSNSPTRHSLVKAFLSPAQSPGVASASDVVGLLDANRSPTKGKRKKRRRHRKRSRSHRFFGRYMRKSRPIARWSPTFMSRVGFKPQGVSNPAKRLNSRRWFGNFSRTPFFATLNAQLLNSTVAGVLALFWAA
eukprot:Gregarina_sp_Poly_1__1981@NODE_151_length_12545_cov_99_072047_g134_i0_p4_GENE_NODE_151_length_12545_cov_99_072047_g134_i0NODE_151_length_12545_cov_99_072047_g134_i0_p4_ORF_typecomplete_len437_score58_67Ins134_P3_kin/PF05770_11/0_3_NODE_151_length_12545_cov_99_072047_g134_i081189428